METSEPEKAVIVSDLKHHARTQDRAVSARVSGMGVLAFSVLFDELRRNKYPQQSLQQRRLNSALAGQLFHRDLAHGGHLLENTELHHGAEAHERVHVGHLRPRVVEWGRDGQHDLSRFAKNPVPLRAGFELERRFVVGACCRELGPQDCELVVVVHCCGGGDFFGRWNH